MAISSCALRSGTFLQLAPWPWSVSCFLMCIFSEAAEQVGSIPKPRFLCRQKPNVLHNDNVALDGSSDTFLVESIFVAFPIGLPKAPKDSDVQHWRGWMQKLSNIRICKGNSQISGVIDDESSFVVFQWRPILDYRTPQESHEETVQRLSEALEISIIFFLRKNHQLIFFFQEVECSRGCEKGRKQHVS